MRATRLGSPQLFQRSDLRRGLFLSRTFRVLATFELAHRGFA